MYVCSELIPDLLTSAISSCAEWSETFKSKRNTLDSKTQICLFGLLNPKSKSELQEKVSALKKCCVQFNASCLFHPVGHSLGRSLGVGEGDLPLHLPAAE